MSKNVGLIGLSILLLLSVVSLIGLYSENSELKEEIDFLNAEQVNKYEEIEDVTNIEDEARFIQTAFNNILNYTSENYNQRLSEAKNHFTAESYQLLQGVGNDENLTLSIQSATSNEQVYKSLQGDNQFVYVAEVSYQLEDNEPVVIEYFYQFNLLENNNEYRIDNVVIIPKQPTIY